MNPDPQQQRQRKPREQRILLAASMEAWQQFAEFGNKIRRTNGHPEYFFVGHDTV
jgi:hypothetical protein